MEERRRGNEERNLPINCRERVKMKISYEKRDRKIVSGISCHLDEKKMKIKIKGISKISKVILV